MFGSLWYLLLNGLQWKMVFALCSKTGTYLKNDIDLYVKLVMFFKSWTSELMKASLCRY